MISHIKHWGRKVSFQNRRPFALNGRSRPLRLCALAERMTREQSSLACRLVSAAEQVESIGEQDD